MKINLGCQRRPFAGWMNIDIAPYPGVDQVADAYCLPFDDESAEEIYAGHIFEHMSNPVKFLLECWRILEPLGRLSLVLPDIACDRECFSDRLFGIVTGFGFAPEEMLGNTIHALHHTFWSFDSLRAFVTIFGFEYTSRIDLAQDWRVTKAYQWQFGQEYRKVDFPQRVDYQAYLDFRDTLEHG